MSLDPEGNELERLVSVQNKLVQEDVQKTKAILLLSDYSKLHVFFSAIKYGEPS
jgi:hypothetical protein